jgi:hypothetical protein
LLSSVCVVGGDRFLEGQAASGCECGQTLSAASDRAREFTLRAHPKPVTLAQRVRGVGTDVEHPLPRRVGSPRCARIRVINEDPGDRRAVR